MSRIPVVSIAVGLVAMGLLSGPTVPEALQVCTSSPALALGPTTTTATNASGAADPRPRELIGAIAFDIAQFEPTGVAGAWHGCLDRLTAGIEGRWHAVVAVAEQHGIAIAAPALVSELAAAIRLVSTAATPPRRAEVPLFPLGAQTRTAWSGNWPQLAAHTAATPGWYSF